MTDVRPTPAAQTRALATPKGAIGAGITGGALLALTMALSLIRPSEGRELTDYYDIAHVATACDGHTGPDVHVGQRRTPAECDRLLASDAGHELAGVQACVPGITSRPAVLAASTDLAHNIGVAGYCHSGTASAFRRDAWHQGCDLMLAWDKARVRGALVTVPGLTARRQRERAMCLVGAA